MHANEDVIKVLAFPGILGILQSIQFICVDDITEKHSKRMVISTSLYLSPVKLTWLAGQ